jgi:transcriptional regulator with XRE-family HTH domain
MKIDSTLVRKIRRERAWSQEQLASVAGLSLRTIQRVEADGSGSLETNMALASAFGVPTIELVFEERASVRASGALIGVVGGVIGALAGLAVGWSGIFSWSLDAQSRGTTFGLMGVASGLTVAFVGTLLKRFFASNRTREQGEV